MEVSFARLTTDDLPAALVRLTPQDARRLPGAPLKLTGRHVVVAIGATVSDTEIKVPMSSLRILGLGDADEGVFVFEGRERQNAPAEFLNKTTEILIRSLPTIPSEPASRGKGDEAFIRALAEIGPEMQRTGSALLERIRELHNGELVATDNPRKFKKSPDNFWAVEIQNRKGAIKFIIRARQSTLSVTGMKYSSERPPSYFYVKVTSDQDIENALQFLSFADRK